MRLFLDDEFAQLAAEVFHEVQLALADLVSLHHFDLYDNWGRGWENLFYAESVAFLADHERFRCASTAGAGHQAFEDLDTLTWFAFGVHVLNFFVETDHHACFNNSRGDDCCWSVGDFSGFDGVGHRSIERSAITPWAIAALGQIERVKGSEQWAECSGIMAEGQDFWGWR